MIEGQIINQENKKKIALSKLKNTTIPNIIYGIGSYAEDLMKLFKKLDIKIDGACIDEEYIDDFPSLFYGMKVMTLENVCKEYADFNIIIGYSNYIIAKSKVERLVKLGAVYFIDDPHSIDFFDYEYVMENLNGFENTYDLLQDEKSKEVFIAYINSKISGEPYCLQNVITEPQYFNDVIPFGKNDIFVDCGAFTGDTVLGFCRKVNEIYNKIYAIEPDDHNYEHLKKTVKDNEIKSIQLVKAGCWSEKAKLNFKSEGILSNINDENGDFTVVVDTIDNIVQNDAVTFIKMDIEGSELEALRGARDTILKNKPNLAICVYHKPEDLITIPEYIYSLMPEYKFYLRHHQFISWDTVIYAVI
jgi:FkbM family methyltransferase